MLIDKTQLDAPAFPSDEITSGESTLPALKDDLGKRTDEETKEEKTTDEKEENQEEEKDEAASSAENDDEKRVPYSRFKKKVDEVQSLKDRLDALKNREKQSESATEKADELPQEWIDLHGDSPESRKYYEVEQRRLQKLEDSIAEKLEARKAKEQEAVLEVEQSIEESVESLQEGIGRKLTNDEQYKILTIVEDYSPTDDQGNIIAPISLEKAYEIYESQEKAASLSVKKAKQNALNALDSSDEGSDTTTDQSRPPSWGDWRKKFND